MARGVAVLFAALALLAVLAAGFGAEAARAEGSIWDKAVELTDPRSYTATEDGFMLVRLHTNEGAREFTVTTPNGTVKTFNNTTAESTTRYITVPVSKGDVVACASGDFWGASYFVPSGGAAVDDGVSGMPCFVCVSKNKPKGLFCF